MAKKPSFFLLVTEDTQRLPPAKLGAFISESHFRGVRAWLYSHSEATTHFSSESVAPFDSFTLDYDPRLIGPSELFCDMDSTLILEEMIDEVAKHRGLDQKIHQLTEEAMQGKISFIEAFKKRISLLKDTPLKVLEQVATKATPQPGVIELITLLKIHHVPTCIVSGGFFPTLEVLRHRLGIDRVYGNHLEIQDQKLTGNILGAVFGAEEKAHILNLSQSQHKSVVAVGDGANDIPMLKLAQEYPGSLGIAYKAKPKVKQAITHHLDHNSFFVLSAFWPFFYQK